MNARVQRTPATTLLIAAILIGLVVQFFEGAVTNRIKLAYLGAIVPQFIREDGEWWRLLTAMFLHGNGTVPITLLHITVSLIALFQLGTLYELMFGTRRFTIIYFVTGIAASLTSLIVARGWSVGASGAIFGIMGAFVFSIRRSPRWRHDRSARSIVNQIVFLSLANILIGWQIPQIDIAAHVGGFVAGLLLGALWPHRVSPPPPAQMIVDV